MGCIKLQKTKAKTIWITTKKIANNELLSLIKKEMFVVTNPLLRFLLLPIIKRTRGTIFDANAEVNDNTAYVQDSSKINFPLPELARAKLFDLITRMKLHQENKYVCLIVRDELHSRINVSDSSATDTEYRNSSIHDYMGAISYLNSVGFSVIRMGRLAQPCNFVGLDFFDYSNSDLRSDENDVLLLANCEFAISTLSGIDEIASLYRKPVYILNYLPVGSFRVSSLRPLVLPKGLVDSQSGQVLTLREIVDRGIWEANSSSKYAEVGVKYVDCSPEAITEFSKQAVCHFQGKSDSINHEEKNSLVRDFFILSKGIDAQLAHKAPQVSHLWLNY